MKKIMFNDKYGLTQAVLEGRKTQTRRIIPIAVGNATDWRAFLEGDYCCVHSTDSDDWYNIQQYARYQIGEEVAVAQSYFDCGYSASSRKMQILPGHFAQVSDGSAGWNNKMFTKAKYMPHRIKITNIRVERLQDISEEDCLNEGLEWTHGIFYVNYNKETGSRMNLGNDYRNAFSSLINKTCGKGTWENNPWVFVYDFELVK